MKPTTWQIWLLATFLLLTPIVGCGKKQDKPVTPAPPIAQQIGAALTEADCLAFAKQLEAAVQKGDRETTGRLYRMNDIAERSISDLDLKPDFRRGVIAGMRKTQGNQLADQMVQVVQNGGKFNFLRIKKSTASRAHCSAC